MLTKNFDDIAQALQNARTVGVASHIRPDADALGSTIAFALWLKDCGKEVTAWNEEGSTAKFHYLPSHDIVTIPSKAPQNSIFSLPSIHRSKTASASYWSQSRQALHCSISTTM